MASRDQPPTASAAGPGAGGRERSGSVASLIGSTTGGPGSSLQPNAPAGSRTSMSPRQGQAQGGAPFEAGHARALSASTSTSNGVGRASNSNGSTQQPQTASGPSTGGSASTTPRPNLPPVSNFTSLGLSRNLPSPLASPSTALGAGALGKDLPAPGSSTGAGAGAGGMKLSSLLSSGMGDGIGQRATASPGGASAGTGGAGSPVLPSGGSGRSMPSLAAPSRTGFGTSPVAASATTANATSPALSQASAGGHSRKESFGAAQRSRYDPNGGSLAAPLSGLGRPGGTSGVSPSLSAAAQAGGGGASQRPPSQASSSGLPPFAAPARTAPTFSAMFDRLGHSPYNPNAGSYPSALERERERERELLMQRDRERERRERDEASIKEAAERDRTRMRERDQSRTSSWDPAARLAEREERARLEDEARRSKFERDWRVRVDRERAERERDQDVLRKLEGDSAKAASERERERERERDRERLARMSHGTATSSLQQLFGPPAGASMQPSRSSGGPSLSFLDRQQRDREREQDLRREKDRERERERERERAREQERQRLRDRTLERDKEREREREATFARERARNQQAAEYGQRASLAQLGDFASRNVKQSIEVLNKPGPGTAPGSAYASPAPREEHEREPFGSRMAYPSPSRASPQKGADDAARQEPFSPARAGRGRLDHAADQAEQAHRRQSTAGPGMLGHHSGKNGSSSNSASAHKRKRSEIFSMGGAREDDMMRGQPPASMMVMDGPAKEDEVISSRKRSKPHAPQVMQPLVPLIDYKALAAAPRLDIIEVRSQQVEDHLRALGMTVLKKHLGRFTYGGPTWSLDGDLLAAGIGATVDIQIPARFLPEGAKTKNHWVIRGERGFADEGHPEDPWFVNYPALRDRRIWGTDVYTDDSDLLAILVHSTWLKPSPPDCYEPGLGDDLEVTMRVAPKLIRYPASERGSLLSRAWGNSHDGVSIVVESARRIPRGTALARGRHRSKARLDELLAERAVLLGQPWSPADLPVEVGGQDLMWTGKKGYIAHPYKASYFREWNTSALSPSPPLDHLGTLYDEDALLDDPMDDDEVRLDSNGLTRANISTHDLVLFTDDLIYVLGLDTSPNATGLKPQFSLSRSQNTVHRPKKGKRQSEFTGLDPRNLTVNLDASDILFTDEGVLVRLPSDHANVPDLKVVDDGVFLTVKGFAWEPRGDRRFQDGPRRLLMGHDYSYDRAVMWGAVEA